jgi:hypothetical protein
MIEVPKPTPEELGYCKHGKETPCLECQKEAEGLKREKFKVIEGEKEIEEKRKELLNIMEKTRQFDAKLDPQEYDPHRITRLKELREKIQNELELGGGQNKCFILDLQSGREGIYKPSSGESSERLDRNISEGKAFVREWLCHYVELNLELGLVPPTVVRENAEGVGSVQEFVPDCETAWRKAGPNFKKKVLDPLEREALEKGKTIEDLLGEKDTISPFWEILKEKAKKDQLAALAVFDFLTENSDRHPNNFMIDKEKNVIAIDNALSFPEKPEDWIDYDFPEDYRNKTILLRMLRGIEIPPQVLGKLEWFKNTPERQKNLQAAMKLALGDELGEEKWREFQKRLDFLLETKRVPSHMYKYEEHERK